MKPEPAPDSRRHPRARTPLPIPPPRPGRDHLLGATPPPALGLELPAPSHPLLHRTRLPPSESRKGARRVGARAGSGSNRAVGDKGERWRWRSAPRLGDDGSRLRSRSRWGWQWSCSCWWTRSKKSSKTKKRVTSRRSRLWEEVQDCYTTVPRRRKQKQEHQRPVHRTPASGSGSSSPPPSSSSAGAETERTAESSSSSSSFPPPPQCGRSRRHRPCLQFPSLTASHSPGPSKTRRTPSHL